MEDVYRLHKNNTKLFRLMPAVIFHISEYSEEEPVGHNHSNYHLIFDVKMDFRRKIQCVNGGHTTNSPAKSYYAGLV